MSFLSALENEMLKADSYRQFIALFFKKTISGEKLSRLSYQSFATRASFSSKSFIADVIASRKRLTPASFDKVVLGLGLNKLWAEYFRCLVSIEESDFCVGKMPQDYYKKRMTNLKKQLSKRKKTMHQKGSSSAIQVMLTPYFPEVYAALGSTEEGATLEQISLRTKIHKGLLPKILSDFEKVHLVKHAEATNRYMPITDSIEADYLQSQDAFEKDYLRSLDKIKVRFRQQANSQSSLFMNQTFSVKTTQLAELRSGLAKIINEFAEQAESFDGDAIAEISIGFTSNFE